ncbi:hypothetical protein LZC95_37710 [Pendulispora brunnea]|uniref:Uncharacterized protein n=1 Tax=Pendulispora brunnea TaxID=2905690 RepID=A0ABZ2K274_9BACT
MSDDLESLPPAMRALLEAGSDGPPASSRMKDRLLQRVEATIHAAAMDEAEDEAPPSRAANDVWGAPPESKSYVASAVGSAPATPAAYATRARLRAARFPLLAAAFAVGLLTGGFVVYTVVRPETGPQVAQTPLAPAPGPEESSQLRPGTSNPPAPVVLPAPASSNLIGAPAPSSSVRVEPETRGSAAPETRDTSGTERALVETARAALARADAPHALVVLERHAHDFPNGSFAEEREALAIQALVKTGDVAAAKTRGDRFRQHYPRSLFMPVVNDATRGL